MCDFEAERVINSPVYSWEDVFWWETKGFFILVHSFPVKLKIATWYLNFLSLTYSLKTLDSSRIRKTACQKYFVAHIIKQARVYYKEIKMNENPNWGVIQTTAHLTAFNFTSPEHTLVKLNCETVNKNSIGLNRRKQTNQES